MAMMQAAIVRAPGETPRCGAIDVPQPAGPHEVLVDVVAVAIHPRTRSGAAGTHYTSSGRFPLVPGIDAVGRRPDGTLIYFVTEDDAIGTMAERAVVDLRRAVVLPGGADPVRVAAGMNPAMSSWVALRRRLPFRPGQQVLVLGATGSAGRLAVQVADHLGAGRVVAAGRNEEQLRRLVGFGASATVALGAESDAGVALGEAAAEVDVVLDYVWGPASGPAMAAIVRARRGTPRRDDPLTWVEIGSVGGSTADLPSAALRAARLQIVGSGQGSVPTADILAELPALAVLLSQGDLQVEAVTEPLARVHEVWNRPGPERVVLVP